MKFSEKLCAITCILLVILVAIGIAIPIVMSLESYTASKVEAVKDNEQPRFRRVIKDNYSTLRVYVDTETNVMYAVRSSAGGICVMVDADGNPLLWDGGTTK